jgi:hypothetical protein
LVARSKGGPSRFTIKSSNSSIMAFADFEDIVENIVDELFLDKTDEDGVYDYYRLPKVQNFLGQISLITPPRTFCN